MYEISYRNLMMYLATIPSYSTKKDEEEETEKITIEDLFNEIGPKK